MIWYVEISRILIRGKQKTKVRDYELTHEDMDNYPWSFDNEYGWAGSFLFPFEGGGATGAFRRETSRENGHEGCFYELSVLLRVLFCDLTSSVRSGRLHSSSSAGPYTSAREWCSSC